MKRQNYTVVVTEEAGSPYPIIAKEEKDKKDAVLMAGKLAKENPEKLVFIEYFRPQDGQQGYINRDGFDITGKSWTDQ